VRDGQADPEVRVQVQQMPGLVPQPGPYGPKRRDHRDDQGDGGGRGEQHARVVHDQVPGLGDEPDLPGGGVPDRDQDDVHQHQVERPEPDQTVPPGELVPSPGPLDQGHPGHQDDL
jgi:hypothetical protein